MENKSSAQKASEETVTQWSKLAEEFAGKGPAEKPQTPEEPEKPLTQEEREALYQRAQLYKKFGKVAIALAQIEGIRQLQTANPAPTETMPTAQENAEDQNPDSTIPSAEIISDPDDAQIDAFYHQLKSALGSLDQSLENQIDYNIINHKQINTREALEQELQSGTAIPELDIRFDKDGKPWISHSPRAGARFLFSKHIHELSSDEVAGIGQRLSLEEGLDMIQQYAADNPNRRVVLEIKELGASEETHAQLLENIRQLLTDRKLTDSTIFATLSPSILRSVHDAFPENSKILNGGIAPVISYDLAENSQSDSPNQEFAFKIPGVDLYLSNSAEISNHSDGYGKQTGYLWTRLPKETVGVLRHMNETDGMGAASLTIVNKFAEVLDKFNPKTAEKLRRHYAEQLDQLGIRKQVAISKSSPVKGAHRAMEQFGAGTVLYANEYDPKKGKASVGDWAEELKPLNQESTNDGQKEKPAA